MIYAISLREKYKQKLQQAMANIVSTLSGIRQDTATGIPMQPLDTHIRAVDICIQNLHILRKALIYFKNTENPIPTGGSDDTTNKPA